MVKEKLMERYDWQQRTALLLGEEKMERIRNAHVLVVGLGGVGAYAAEMICRAGVGRMTIVDADTVQPTNMNRQLPAMHSTLGMSKAEVLAARYKDINPDIELTVLPVYLKDENIPELLDANQYDFIVDAIDTISPKCFLIYEAMKRRIKIVSSMGAGAKSDITQVRFADLWETYHCGLSKAVRKRLQKMEMKRKLPVVFSTERMMNRIRNRRVEQSVICRPCLGAIWLNMSLNDYKGYYDKTRRYNEEFRLITSVERH